MRFRADDEGCENFAVMAIFVAIFRVSVAVASFRASVAAISGSVANLGGRCLFLFL